MSKSVYTPEQVTALTEAANVAPFNQARAAEFAEKFGFSSRSVIAKVKSLDLPYQVKANPAAKKAAASKADLVAAIEKAVDADDGSLNGLVKAPMVSLAALLANIS